MSLTDIGNCRHHWQFRSTNWTGSVFSDLVGSADASLNSGVPTYVTQNSVQGLDIGTGTQYLTFADTECLGELSFICVMGYRGGGQAYGLCTTDSTTGLNFYQGATGNNAQFWRSALASTTGAPLNQSAANIVTMGTRLETGKIFIRVDDDSEFTNDASPDDNDATFNTHDGWQFGRRYTATADPIQHIYELAAYIGDVTTDSGYAAEITALKTTYGIS